LDVRQPATHGAEPKKGSPVILTENAVEVIHDLTDEEGATAVAGVRIAVDPNTEALTVEPVEEPFEGDEVVESLGARVFLDSDAADLLDDKALDASVDDDGAVQFSVIERVG
jgi:iron-sulfur cluster assembly protein